MIFRRRSDLPLSHDATSRFLPWLVALMVFLSAMALAGVFVLSGIITRWDFDVSGTLTVQVSPVGGSAAESEARTQAKVDQAIQMLRATPGIADARALDKGQTLALLEPWLGSTDLIQDLPLPRLIDVTLIRERRVDLTALAQLLAQKVPGASLDDHRVWLERLINLSRTIEMLAIAVVALIGAVTSATVVYATRTGMAVHHEVIEVLHLIGAHNDYIARQFADRAFALGLLGGGIGLGFALPALLSIGWAAARVEGGFLPDLRLPPAAWITLAALPLVAALLARVTAHLTVRRSIARMP